MSVDNTYEKARIQFSKAKYEDWMSADPVLLAGELVIVTDIPDQDKSRYRFKIGNGISKFSQLKWYSQNTKADKLKLGIPNGYASLNISGRIPLSQLPDIGDIVQDIKDKESTTVETKYIDVPVQKNISTYTGDIIYPEWTGYNSDKMSLSGELCGKNVGEYTVDVKPLGDYKWFDDSTDTRQITWKINKASLDVSTMVPKLDTSTRLVYDGTVKTPIFLNYDQKIYTMSRDVSGTDAGIYTAQFTLSDNYSTSDDANKIVTINWYIYRKPMPIPTLDTTAPELTFNNEEQFPTFINYPAEGISITSGGSGIDSGTYTAIFNIDSNHMWSDEFTTSKSVEWSIGELIYLTTPALKTSYTYTGDTITPEWLGYNPKLLRISGTISAVNAGDYVATFTPKEEITWGEGTTESRNVTWTIHPAVVSLNTILQNESDIQEYTGEPIRPVITGFDSSYMTLSGTTEATDAGEYEVTITLNNDGNHVWESTTPPVEEPTEPPTTP